MFLLLVDANTKWINIHVVNSSSSQITIKKVRATFATLGLPQILVTDNGPQFTSSDFAQFTKNNGIKYVTSSPYHPSTNGLAERSVQTFKEGMRKQKTGSIETRVSRFLFAYRNTPQSTTSVSPAMLMFNRQLQSHLDLLKPDMDTTVLNRQIHQQLNHDAHARNRQFQIGDNVVENFSYGPKWLAGTVKQVRRPLTYMVKLLDDRIVQRHVDHIRIQTCGSSSVPDDVLPNQADTSSGPLVNDDEPPQEPTQSPTEQSIRSSSRISRPPNRYRPDS